MSLHIHAQFAWHDPAYIVGTKESLKDLRDLIDDAIKAGDWSEDFFVGDGEGFKVHVLVRSEEHMATKAAVPYTDLVAKENRSHTIYPWKEV